MPTSSCSTTYLRIDSPYGNQEVCPIYLVYGLVLVRPARPYNPKSEPMDHVLYLRWMYWMGYSYAQSFRRPNQLIQLMNKRITSKVAKRRANSPEAVELRRTMMEIALAIQQMIHD